MWFVDCFKAVSIWPTRGEYQPGEAGVSVWQQVHMNHSTEKSKV